MVPPIKPCPEDSDEETIEFSLIGLVALPEFQKCLTYIETLNKCYPKIYLKPYIRPMLEFDWLEYVTKMQRTMGGQFWHLKKNCAVFVNKEYLGDDDDLLDFVSKRLVLKLRRDYECMAHRGLLDVYQKYLELGRKFVYFSIAVNHHIIGHMIFMLYADLVPKTSERFIKKCKSKKNGFKGTAVHRIMGSGWIQFGDYKLPLKNRDCENYTIPHNRRGVLSMCNDGRYIHNTSQFFVCLNPTDWMDYRYVAFGQLVQGDHVLRQLEKHPTYYEHPEPDDIIIADCGEVTLDDTVEAKQKTKIEKYLKEREKQQLVDVKDSRDTVSVLMEAHYAAGDYFFEDDNEPHLPMTNLPSVEDFPMSYATYSSSGELYCYTYQYGDDEQGVVGQAQMDLNLVKEKLYYIAQDHGEFAIEEEAEAVNVEADADKVEPPIEVENINMEINQEATEDNEETAEENTEA